MILDKISKESNNLKSSPIDWDAEVSITRPEASYEDVSERFRCREKDFTRQYSYTYSSRLKSMQDAVRKNCVKKWGNEIPILKLSELAELKRERCVIIGTIFKRQDLIPSILKEISEENQLVPQPKLTNYVSPLDQLILEDELQRIPLKGNIEVNKLVSGVVVGILGIEDQHGFFEVEDFVFGNRDSGSRTHVNLSHDRYILLVSGLDVGGTTNALSLQLLVDWINGELGCPADQYAQSAICRVIVAGNSIKASQSISNGTLISSAGDENTELLSCVKMLDKFLLELVKTIEVDIMPGEFDPSNHTLPQQPFHKCIFPRSSNFKTLHRVPNPYECLIEGRRIAGTAGQPINDIKSLTDLNDNLSILESTLHWSHLAPTAPDTIACYPYYKDDPFIMTEQPDIYFAGNSSSFETKITYLNGRPVRLICLPVFSQTQTCALLNLKTLECTPLHFSGFCEGND